MRSVEYSDQRRADLSILERNPLEEFYEIKKTWISMVTPQRYPDLFKSRPELANQGSDSGEAEGGHGSLYTLAYVTEPLSFEDLYVDLDDQPIDLSSLIFAQHRLEIPAKTVKFVSWRKFSGINEYWMKPIQEELAQIFEKDDMSPDLEHASPTGPIDRAANEFLAYQLTLRENLQTTIIDPQQLEDFARKNGLKIDFVALLEGFYDLSAHPSRFNGDHQKILDMYESSSDWSLMIAEYIFKNSKDVSYMFPHAYPAIEQQTRDITLLPYMAMSLLNFAVDIPYLLKQGREYYPEKLREAVADLYKLTYKSLVSALERKITGGDLVSLYNQAVSTEPVLAQRVKGVTDFMRELKPCFDRLLKVFRDNPSLLNRKGQVFTPGKIAGYEDLRQEIIDSGAKISKKTFAIQLKPRVRRGEI